MTEDTVFSLADVVRGLVEGGESDDWAITDAVLAVMPFDVLRAAARHQVHVDVRNARRKWARDVEAQLGPPARLDRAAWVSKAALLLQESFLLPDGRRVAWLDASAADHLARAGWHRGLADAAVLNAARHEAAAQTILDAGVTCLRDLTTTGETNLVAKPISIPSRRKTAPARPRSTPNLVTRGQATHHDPSRWPQPRPKPGRGDQSNPAANGSAKPNDGSRRGGETVPVKGAS